MASWQPNAAPPICNSVSKLLDVIEVEIAAPHRVRVMAQNKHERDAEAIVAISVMRWGVETHFFKTAPAGHYKDGDTVRQD
jgi:hypothetical protein